MTTDTSSVVVVCIYRPPGLDSATFRDKLSDLFDRLVLLGKKFIACGDFNCPSSAGSTDLLDERLTNLLSRYNLTQHVN